MITLEQIKSFLKVFKGATSSEDGLKGLVPQPKKAQAGEYYLNSSGSWKKVDFSGLQSQIDTLDDTTVKLTGTQTISGNKTFTGQNYIKSSDIDITTTPSANQYKYFDYYDKNNKRIGVIGAVKNTGGEYGVYLQGGNESGIQVLTNANGDALAYAPTPVNSANNRQIATTAWTRTNAVMTSGNQTVNGVKSFTGLLNITTTGNELRYRSIMSDIAQGTAPSANRFGGVRLMDKNGVELAQTYASYQASGAVMSCLWVKQPVAGGTATASINITYPASGSPYTYCINPASTSNTTNIATTSWVRNMQPLLNSISATSGTVSLATNKIYTMTISGNTTFTLPSATSGVFNQIKVIAKVNGTYTINWGTTRYFNKTAPDIEAGNYDFYFDYDPLLGAWVAGAIPKGTA